MCDPLSIGLALAGSYANNRVQNQYIEAQNNANNQAFEISEQARKAEQVRQDALVNRRDNTFTEAAQAVDPGKKMDGLDAEADAALAEVLAARGDTGAMPSWMRGSGQLTEELSAVGNRVVQEKRGQLSAASKMRAMQGQDNAGAVALTRGFADQDFLGDTMRGSLGVSEQERNISPATVTKGSTLMGDLLLAGSQYAANSAGMKAGQAQVAANPYRPNFGG